MPISSTSFLMLSSSASRSASLNWFWKSRAMRFTWPVHFPTLRRTRGKSFGPMTTIATTAMTSNSDQPMSDLANAFGRAGAVRQAGMGGPS